MFRLLLGATLGASSLVAADYTIYVPNQVHLALGHDASSMSVQWSTADGGSDTLDSTVRYGLSPTALTEIVQGESVRWFSQASKRILCTKYDVVDMCVHVKWHPPSPHTLLSQIRAKDPIVSA